MDHLTLIAELALAGAALRGRSRSGSDFGHVNNCGEGYGNGNGRGYGNSTGYGNGAGYGYGCGYGLRNGCGHGNGDGCGLGIGSAYQGTRRYCLITEHKVFRWTA